MPGFDFSNHTRNAALHARGVPLPKATSTGTTIVGCIFDGGVVVSDTLLYDCRLRSIGTTPEDRRFMHQTGIQSSLYTRYHSADTCKQIAADTRATSGPIVADKVTSITNTGQPQ